MPELGRDISGDPVEIDIARLLTTNLGIVANPGAGKSQTVRKVLELAAGGPQRIVLDVEDEFYTLREASPNMILAGGENGDCPATVDNAAALARFLLEIGADAVIQLNDLELDGQCAFISRFLNSLIDAPRSLWHPTLIVVDEAHRYAPNNAVAESLPAVSRLVLQGRKRTFGTILATPRSADVSTKVRGMINNWLLGRASQTVDIDAVSKLLGVRRTSDEARGLPKLKEGQFWGFGPAVSIEPRLIAIGKVETTHLQPGQRDVPTPPAPEEIRAMLAKLHVEPTAIPASNMSISSPSNEGPKMDTAAIERSKQQAYERGIAEGRRLERADWIENDRKLRGAINAAMGYLAPYLESSRDDIETPVITVRHPPEPPTIEAEPQPSPTVTLPPRRRERAAESPTDGVTRVTGPQQKILDALAWWEAVRIPEPTRVQVAMIAGYSPNSGGFANLLGSLNTGGRLVYPKPGVVALTEAGRAAANRPAIPTTTQALHERVYAHLSKPQARVLSIVIAAYPAPVEREAIATRAGYSASSGGFANLLGGLRSLGLINYPGRGQVQAESILFIDKRPRAVGGAGG